MAVLKSITDIIAKFEEQLTCSICKEIFTYPKTLPCLHSFCTHCITQWYEKSENQDNNQMECPMCKKTMVVPGGYPTKLPSAFYIDSFLQLLHAMKTKASQPQLPDCVNCEQPQVLVAFCTQCNGFLCEDCVNLHEKVKQMRDRHQPVMLNEFKEINVSSFMNKQMLCKFHDKKKPEYYCQTCAVCICQKCVSLEHRDHKMQSLEDAALDAKTLIEGAMNRVEKHKEKDEKELQQFKENMQRIQREIGEAERNINDVVEMICDMAKEHGRVMKDELKKMLQELKAANDEERTAVKTRLEESDEFVQHCQVLLQRDVPYEEIESKEMILERSQMLSEAHSIFYPQPLERNVTIRYCMTEQVMQSLQDIGKIAKNVTDPAHSTIELVNSHRGFINECNIITRNTKGKVCPTRIESIDVRIKDMEGNDVEKQVSEKETGKYRVRFKPHNTGEHGIQVNIGGEAIKNSPQNVHINDVEDLFKPVITFCRERGSGRGQLNLPLSIAVDDNGEIAIADSGNHRIQIFSLDGNYLRGFGRLGAGEGHLYYPRGVVFVEDRALVSDGKDGKGRIQEFDLNGAYVRTIYRPEQWFAPRGMCVNDEKSIAVCCYGNQELDIKPSIKVFSKQGDLVQEFDMHDNEQPRYITYGNGKYFISFLNKSYVRVFDHVNRGSLYKFGDQGQGDGQFNDVCGLAVYGLDLLLVCDRENHRVQVFTQEGQFIRSFGNRGSGVCQMDGPVDVVVTPDGRVFVVECIEWHSHRVSVWY